jgi:hypothetical protein
MFEMEQVLPGEALGDPFDDPIIRANAISRMPAIGTQPKRS